MTTKYVKYCSTEKLPCAFASVKDVILCLQSADLLVPQPCVNSDSDCQFSFIPATICQAYSLTDNCCNNTWYYTFSYDDTLLIDPSVGLQTSDITGVFCKDCLTTYVEEISGFNQGTILSPNFLFGDGADGDLTVTNGQDLPIGGADPNGRNYYYNNLTIDAGGTFHPWGTIFGGDLELYCIFVKGTLTINGTISVDGPAASGKTGGVYFPFITDGPGGGIDEGGDGGDSGHHDGFPPARDRSSGAGYMGGSLGGASGKGGGGSGGLGYTPIIPNDGDLFHVAQILPSLVGFSSGGSLISDAIGGGCAGAGGGYGQADGGNPGGEGGGGGAAGGSIYIAARNIVIGATGKISVKGGNAANGSNASSGNASGGGGGGGGGGGLVYMIYKTLDNQGTIDVSAGAGGTGGMSAGSGSAGSSGVAGTVGNIVKINVTKGIFE